MRHIAALLAVEIDDEDIGLATSQKSLTSRVRTRDTETLKAINDKLQSE